MQSEDNKVVDLYIPRKCEATNKLIHPTDHASVHINIAQVDANGVITGSSDSITIGGYMRRRGYADCALNRLFHDRKLLSFNK
mmetsp:Transcript_17772/g.19947  ORF Transcript_17772/g.19947 Transcript_17772/m.19947 type:complete len:83 (-) Transcript_17772:38-286(-)